MSRETTIQAKQEEVNIVIEKIRNASSVVVAEYSGLTVQKISELRKQLRKESCELHVLKNNVVKRAVDECGYPEFNDSLQGPNAICFANGDSVAAAKVLYEYSKKNKEVKLKVGVVDGSFYNAKDIVKIATLPNKITLIGMLAGGMIQTLKELAIGMNMVAEQKQN